MRPKYVQNVIMKSIPRQDQHNAMEKFIEKIFSKRVLDEALRRYSFKKSNTRRIGGFQSFVYECKRNGEIYILKLTHSSHRSEKMICGELDWIQFLDQNGVSVCRPIFSNSQKLTEVIRCNNSYFTVVAYEKAKGGPLRNGDWNSNLFELWGKNAGKMHYLSKKYAPYSHQIRRPSWDSEDNYNVEKFIPPYQKELIRKFHNIKEKINRFPRGSDSFGLIHADLNATNFFLHNNQLIFFDFDGCVYSWFIHDIAILLICTLQFDCIVDDKAAFAHQFLDAFCEGYYSENFLAPTWFEKLPDFLKLEEFGEYNLIYRSCDINNLKYPRKEFMESRREKIENDILFIDLDFRGLTTKLSKN